MPMLGSIGGGSAKGFGMFSTSVGWTFVAAGAYADGSTSISVPLPSGIQVGDLLIILAGGSNTLTPPSGYTVVISNGNASTYQSFWYKFAGASETAPTVTGLAHITAVMVAYRNISTLDVAGSVLYNGGASTSVSTQSATTTNTNDLVISSFVVVTAGGAWTTTPSGTAVRAQVNLPIVTGSRGLLLCDELQASAGATAVRTAAFTSSAGASGLTVAFH